MSAISALISGYDTGVISGALLQIRRDFHTGSGTEQLIAGLPPPKRRGQLVLGFQAGIGVGIVVSTIVGATQLFSSRYSVAFAAGPALLMLLRTLRLPESPRWLVTNDDRDGAVAVVRRIRPDGVDVEMREIEGLAEQEQEESRLRSGGSVRATSPRLQPRVPAPGPGDAHPRSVGSIRIRTCAPALRTLRAD